MADIKISALTSASALGGTEILPGDQGGNSRGVTVNQIDTFVNNKPVFAAGTASAGTWPVFTAGTILTSAVIGTVELDGTNFYLTTDTGNRGIVPVTQFIRQHANRAAFTSNTSQQAIFDSVTNGTLTLATGAYVFEAVVAQNTMSATSGNGKFSLIGAGGATLAVVLQQFVTSDIAIDTTSSAGGSWTQSATQTATNIGTASTATTLSFIAKGSFEVTVAGTIIPSFAQTTAAAAVVLAGSYFRCTRISAATAVSVGAWT